MSGPTRAERLRIILSHLDVLVDDLDGAHEHCAHCGLKKSRDWSESQAKRHLREQREKFERMLAQGWALKGEDDAGYAARNEKVAKRNFEGGG